MSSFHFVKCAFVFCHIACCIWLARSVKCLGSAYYDMTLRAELSTENQSTEFSGRVSFNPVFGCSHNSSYVMWRPGEKATPGVQQVAETGKTNRIYEEIDEQIKLKTVSYRFEQDAVNGTEFILHGIEASSDYPLISAIAKVTSSPDWFVGARDLNFCNETTGEWMDFWENDLFPYDAGTDDGLYFNSTNTPSNPQADISLITKTESGSFNNKDPMKRLGTLTSVKTLEMKESVQDNNPSTTTTKNVALPQTCTNNFVFLMVMIVTRLNTF